MVCMNLFFEKQVKKIKKLPKRKLAMTTLKFVKLVYLEIIW